MASTETFTSRKSGSLWILPYGPNTKPEYLPCYDLEDIQKNQGGITLIQCIDALGQYQQIDATEDAPEPTTLSLSTYIGKVADFLELVKCPFPLLVHLTTCGRKDSFENYDRTYIVQVQKVSSTTLSGLVRKDEDVPAMQSFDLEAFPNVVNVFRLATLSESVSETADINDITFLAEGSCWDNCGTSKDSCDYGYAASEALAGSPSDVASVLTKTPTQTTWTPTAANPFGAGEDIASIVVFPVGKNTTRILVARGTTDAGNPAEVAYSDDDGATWTNVNVGTTNGQFAVGAKTLFAFNRYEIWLAATGGYIYKSEDGGATWTAQESGVITTANYNKIQFVPNNPNTGYAVAADGVVVKTVNGGMTWGSVTSPGANSITALSVIDRNRLWVGTTIGGLFYSTDGGTTWSTRNFEGSSGASTDVFDIVFVNDYVGFLTQTASGAGSNYFTINGGFSWEVQSDVPTNTGINVLWACEVNNLYSGANAGAIFSSTIQS